MQIYIMRHGQAELMASSDSARELTSFGENEVQAIGNYFKKHKLVFDAIWVSPYVRAQQTANIVANVLAQADKLETSPLITPSGIASEVHDYLDGLLAEQDHQRILIVSHMPLVSYLVGNLTGGDTSPLFQTASVATINYNKRQCMGELTSHVSPATI